jgi:acyl-[acyl carrier protein]--UDP-N-acetylglucosamine O-acyltransferase
MQSYNGQFLRRKEMEALGVTCRGDEVSIHVSVVIINPPGLQIGNGVRIDPFCLLSAGGGMRLGDHIHIGSHCSLIGGAGIELEDFAGVSHGARLFSTVDDMDGSHLTGPTVPNEFRRIVSSPIRVKRHAVIGTNAVVFPGVTIGEGSIIGALSLVREDVPDWSIYAGIPAKRVGTRGKDLLRFEIPLAEK